MTVSPGASAPGGSWLTGIRRYLAVLLVGSLAWEFLHMPLYTLWSTDTWGRVVL
jgi:hypothetical protein